MLDFTISFSIPYIFFFIAYMVAVLIILFLAAASLYHLVKYGFMSGLGLFMTFLLIAGTFFIFFISYEAISTIDWQQQISFGQTTNTYDPF